MFMQFRFNRYELLGLSWLFLVGAVFSYVSSGGLGGYKMSLLVCCVSFLMIRRPNLHLYVSSPSMYFCAFTTLVIFVSVLYQYFVQRNYGVSLAFLAFCCGAIISVITLYFRPHDKRYFELAAFILVICLGFILYNLAVTSQIPRDVLIKETLASSTRNLNLNTNMGSLYFERFRVDNHIIIPNTAGLGIALFYSLMHTRFLWCKVALAAVGLCALIPAWYFATRGPIFAFVLLFPLFVLYSFRIRKNRIFVTLISFSVGFAGVALILRDFSILDRIVAVFIEGDGRFYLWANATKMLFGQADSLFFSHWAHNYILDMGLLLGVQVAIVLFIISLLFAFISARLLFFTKRPLYFGEGLLLWFLLSGFLLSMIQPPNAGLHIFYGILITSLPYLFRRYKELNRPLSVPIYSGR
jgi:hypothetical protein